MIRTYRPDIDGLRAIAVLVVVAFHAAPGRLPSGFIGVDIFFVISGFLISSILFKDLDAGDLSLNRFYERRVRRIFPALILVLAFCLASGYLVLVDEQLRALCKHVLGGFTFTSNLVLWQESGYFDSASDYKPLLHLWSLGIEEQFYVIWPLLLWAAIRYGVRRAWLILVLTALSFGWSVYGTGADRVGAFYSPLTRFWELLAGAALANVMRRGLESRPLSPIASNAASVAGLTALLAGLWALRPSQPFPGWLALLPVSSAVLMIAAGPQAWVNRHVLSNRVLVAVGLISFPLYLWHWPLLSFLRIIEGGEVAQWKRGAAVAAAFILAWLTYRFVERPVRSSVSGKRVVPVVLLSMFAVGAAGAAGYLGGGFSGRAQAPAIAHDGDIGHDAFFAHLAATSYPCAAAGLRREAGDWKGIERCFQSKRLGAVKVALVGDSHAEHLYPGIAEQLTGLNVAYYGRAGLPFLGRTEFDAIFQEVLQNRDISSVLLSANWLDRLKGLPQSDWAPALASTVRALAQAGKAVYIADGVPVFTFRPDRCKYVGRLGIANKCEEGDHPAASGYRRVMREVLQDSGQGSTHLLETYTVFCNGAMCSMAPGGGLAFRDEHHLNIEGSRWVARKIAANLVSHP